MTNDIYSGGREKCDVKRVGRHNNEQCEPNAPKIITKLDYDVEMCSLCVFPHSFFPHFFFTLTVLGTSFSLSYSVVCFFFAQN